MSLSVDKSRLPAGIEHRKRNRAELTKLDENEDGDSDGGVVVTRRTGGGVNIVSTGEAAATWSNLPPRIRLKFATTSTTKTSDPHIQSKTPTQQQGPHRESDDSAKLIAAAVYSSTTSLSRPPLEYPTPNTPSSSSVFIKASYSFKTHSHNNTPPSLIKLACGGGSVNVNSDTGTALPSKQYHSASTNSPAILCLTGLKRKAESSPTVDANAQIPRLRLRVEQHTQPQTISANNTTNLNHLVPPPASSSSSISTRYNQHNRPPHPSKKPVTRGTLKIPAETNATALPPVPTNTAASKKLTDLIDIGNSFDPMRERQYNEEDDLLIKDDPHGTQKRAHEMVRWAIVTNDRLRSEFDLRQILGWGGCGAVVGGYRRSDRQKIALKFIYKKRNNRIINSTPQEIEILQSLSHPSIVRFYLNFEDDRIFYLVMEQFGTAWKSDQIDMNGSRITESLPALVIHPLFKTDENPNNNDNRISTSSLASSSSYSLHSPLGDDKCSPVFLIVSQASCASLFDFIDFHGGHLPREIVPGLFKSLASAVHHMHSKGIVHGDIKEENILVGIMRSTKSSQDEVGCISRYGFPSAGSYFSDGDDKLLQSPHLTAKLCDFGHSLRAKRNNKTMVRYGTKDISAPELLHNLRLEESAQERPLSYHRYFGFEQDVWALGLLLYTMIHGELPAEINDYIDGEMKCRKNSHLPVDFDPTMERDCLDLLKRMLAIDPTRRISIQGVLDHPFVKRNRAR